MAARQRPNGHTDLNNVFAWTDDCIFAGLSAYRLSLLSFSALAAPPPPCPPTSFLPRCAVDTTAQFLLVLVVVIVVFTFTAMALFGAQLEPLSNPIEAIDSIMGLTVRAGSSRENAKRHAEDRKN